MSVLELKGTYNVEDLKRLFLKGTDDRSRQRLQAIYLRALGKTPPEIARLLGCRAKTVRTWIKLFNAGGPAALAYKHTGGRTAKLNEEQENALMAALKQLRPGGGRWTLKALAEKLYYDYGIRLSKQQISQRVNLHGLRQHLSRRPVKESWE
jgi:transposase